MPRGHPGWRTQSTSACVANTTSSTATVPCTRWSKPQLPDRRGAGAGAARGAPGARPGAAHEGLGAGVERLQERDGERLRLRAGRHAARQQLPARLQRAVGEV